MLRVICIFILLFTPLSYAQEREYSIVAVVNDEVISTATLDARIMLAIKAAAIEDNEDNRRRLASPILNGLITEYLYAQDARARGYIISDDLMRKAVRSLEEQNGVLEGKFKQFIELQGIEYSTITTQLELQILRQMVEARVIRPDIYISPFEIEEAYQQRLKQKDEEVHLHTIFIPDDGSGGSSGLAKDIVRRLRAGASFSKLAKSFSQGPSAASGGEIGWFPISQLSPMIANATYKMADDKTYYRKISDPIITPDGVQIIYIKDRRASDTKPPSRTEVEAQLVERKFDLAVKEYTKKLRGKAFIDVRI